MSARHEWMSGEEWIDMTIRQNMVMELGVLFDDVIFYSLIVSAALLAADFDVSPMISVKVDPGELATVESLVWFAYSSFTGALMFPPRMTIKNSRFIARRR
jgi:hypothetical protein